MLEWPLSSSCDVSCEREGVKYWGCDIPYRKFRKGRKKFYIFLRYVYSIGINCIYTYLALLYIVSLRNLYIFGVTINILFRLNDFKVPLLYIMLY